MTTTSPMFTVGKMLTEEEAKAALDAVAYAQGGGWFRFAGRNIYVCTGCHRDGKVGWQVKEIR